MNILFFTNEYNHPNLSNSGGAGTFFKLLATELSKRGHKVYVFGSTSKEMSFYDEGVELKFCKRVKNELLISILRKILKKNIFKYTNAILERKYWASELKKFICNKNIDIIETWDYRGIYLYLDKLKVPVIIRCHGSLGLLKNYFGYKNIDEVTIKIELNAIKNYNNIIAVSKFSKKINEKWFNKNNIEVIYNGIDSNVFKSKISAKILNKSIYYFGTITEKKGLYDLALIFNKIVQKYPRATLHLIGKGSQYLEYLKSEVFNEKALLNLVYHGVVEYSQIPQKLLNAHVIVFPTKGENFPFSFLEAMSMEKPVIVSNIEVSKEIIVDGVNGYIAASNQEFIDKIDIVFNNCNKEISSNARKTIIKYFSISEMTENTIKYYNQIMEL